MRQSQNVEYDQHIDGLVQERHWSNWPVADDAEIDAMIDAYKKDTGLTETRPPEIKMELPDHMASGESEDSVDGPQLMEVDPPVKNGGSQAVFFTGVREGLASCEFCRRVGIKHAFYSKSKRFCSLACSRSFSASAKENKVQRKSSTENNSAVQKYKSPQTLIQNKPDPQSFDWSEYLNDTQATAASVTCFKHSPMSNGWDNISPGLKVEVLNTDCDLQKEVYWVATVIKLAGYRALMRYEGFGTDNRSDFWVNLCIQDVHPVGFCASNGKLLVPPQSILDKYVDWKDFLVKRLTGARTLPKDFYPKVQESLTKHPLKPGMLVEVVDRTCVSAMRVATVEEVIGGRLRLQYEDSKNGPGDEFWCHRESPLVHPMGWAAMVGHKLHSGADYKTTSLNKIAFEKQGPNDSTPEMFIKTPDTANGLKFQPGMKLEAIDPLNLVSICVATVRKVLRNNYLMIGIDGSEAENGQDWFCYHATSPCIFPVGFCEVNNLELTPPRGYKGEFRWFEYMRETKTQAAPVKLFQREIPKHGFRLGMKVEAVDLMEPRLICVGTIMKVVGRLLRIHFDGWESSYDQWVDCISPDIYPVGWCEMVGYHLEGPKPRDSPNAPQVPMSKKRKGKGQTYKGSRKKRRHSKPSMGASGSWPPGDMDDTSRGSATSGTDTVGARFWEPESRDSRDEKPKDLANLSPALASTGSPATHDAAVPKLSDASATERAVGTPVSSNSAAVTGVGGSQACLPVCSAAMTSANSGLTAVFSLASSPAKPAALFTATLGSKLGATSPPAILVSTSMPPPNKTVSPSGLLSSMSGGGVSPDGKSSPPHVSIYHIPRVIPGEPDKDAMYTPPRKDQPITPEAWDIPDVCQFLRINDCGPYCDSFSKKGITGSKFMVLTKEQIVNLTGMKVGPSLKIYDLIQQLKITVAAQCPTSPPVGSTPAAMGQRSPVSSATLTSTVVISQSVAPLHSPALKAQLTAAPGLPMS